MKNICEQQLLLNSIKKETPTQVFSCELRDLFKNTYFVEHLRAPGSEMPVSGSLFNKVARISPSNHFSYEVVFFPFLQISKVWSLKSIYLVDQWYIRRRNSQARLIMCIYGNQVETSLSSSDHICTDLGIPIAAEVEEKEELKNLLKCGKLSFYVMVDREIFTYLKNKK